MRTANGRLRPYSSPVKRGDGQFKGQFRGHALQNSSVRSGILFAAGSGPDEDQIIKGIGLGRWPRERDFAEKG